MIKFPAHERCTGCEACANVCPQKCISFQEDAEGFFYPEINAGICRHCHLCEKVCPVVHSPAAFQRQGVYAAKNPDEKIRMASSSGGVFSMLCEAVLTENGVVFGAAWTEDWVVSHVAVESVDQLKEIRGSKYLQSRIGNSYRQVKSYLEDGRKVLFSGTACQIAGLRNFLQRDYENLLTVDVVCHGVPSPGVWKCYLSALTGNRTVTGIEFRNKKYGWSKFSLKIESGEWTYQQMLFEDLFMKGFLSNLYLRPSCRTCPFKGPFGVSDLSLADYWGIGKFHPDFDDDRGVSLILTNTEKGADLLSKLNFTMLVTPYSEALAGNSALERSPRFSSHRSVFFTSFEKDPTDLFAQIEKYTKVPLWEKCYYFGRGLLGRLLRAVGMRRR